MERSQQYDLVVRNGQVITLDPSGSRYPRGDVAVLEGAIAAIGPSVPGRGVTEIDAHGNAVLPGLIDCHMHETLLRGFCEDLPLMRWLEEICFPIDRAFQPQHQRAAALMCQLEMIRGGITTFIDIYRYPAEAAAVAERSGLRAIFSPQIIDNPPGPGETLESTLEFIREWKERVPNRIYTWFGPHAPYSVKPETFRMIAAQADELGVGVHTHLAETTDEVDQFRRQSGQTPVEYLAGLGMDNRWVVAHGVHLTDQDIGLLAERDVAVAHNPSSNMKLASGVARIPDLLAAGIRVGLGTDSNLSNNNLDMFEEMRLAAMLQKLSRRDAESMPCEKVLRLATSDAAACLGLPHVGSLEVGKRGDLIIVDLHAPHMWPVLSEPHSNVVEQLVYSASAGDVLTTVVEGKVLMRDRQVFTLDAGVVEPQVKDAARDLAERAGLVVPSKKPGATQS